MRKKVLITGITGFAGSHLAQLLASEEKYDIHGTYLSEKTISNVKDNIKDVVLHKIDLTDDKKVTELISLVQPDLLFHLAALASPKYSFANPAQTFTNNVAIQLNLLEAIVKEKLSTRVLIISSGDVYGLVKKEDLPIDEDTPMRPTNSYAVSKIAQDFIGLQYFLTYHIPVVRVRPFNHIGPRQSDDFAISSFAKRIVEIEKKKQEPILMVGNLEAKRDFTDVRDTVKAYELAIEKGESGEVYNIGFGRSYKIRDVLNKMLLLTNVKIEIKSDTSLFRPSDDPELLCDSTRFRQLTNWVPVVSIEKTLKDTLDYWRNIV